MAIPTYEVFAIRYAERDGWRRNAFQGGDAHDGPLPMDYFVWLVRNKERTFVLDIGFTAEMAVKRKRNFLRTPKEGLALLGVKTEEVEDVIISHLHYDHVGTYPDFPNAKFHLQDDEMRYATGRYMRYGRFKHGYEVDDIVGMVRLVHQNRVDFYDGAADLAPGISIHRIGGHTMGLQCMRVHTERGWVVLASDCSHYYENFETNRFYASVFNVGEQADGFEEMRRLADSSKHIVPGHDPLVMKRYPAASKELTGIVVRLDVPPNE